MKIPIISRLWESRAGTKNNFWQSTYRKLPLTRMAVQTDSTAADITALKDDFNALLTKLKNAGLMASE